MKRQAKDLLALYKGSDPTALARFRDALPAAAGKDDPTIANLGLRLHDAQSCVAREYGFSSWADLRTFVEARSAHSADRAETVLNWLRLIYAGDISGSGNRARPAVAARMLDENPDLPGEDAYLACAIGDEARLRHAARRRSRLAQSSRWSSQPPAAGGRDALESAAACLAFASACTAAPGSCCRPARTPTKPSAAAGSRHRWPSPRKSYRLSALYGACGQNHDPELTRLLLEGGANPNDGELLYHALENLACTRLLLEAGARIAEANAMYRVLDLDDVDALRLLLSHGGNPNQPAMGPPTSDWGSPLLWAIRRRRSPAHVSALLEAGADASARTPDGAGAYTLALRFGLPDVAELLRKDARIGSISQEEQFIAACARGDEASARRIQSARPDLPGALSEAQLRLLPELAAQGCSAAVRAMVNAGLADRDPRRRLECLGTEPCRLPR